MFQRDKSYFCLILFLIGLSFFPLAMPTSSSVDLSLDPLFSKVPMQIGVWKGRNVVLDERTYEILETRNVLSRTFKNPEGKTVDLLLVGSHRDRRVAHPPEVCYVGANFDIVNIREGSVRIGDKKIPIKEFVAHDKKHPSYRENVLYVYKAGDFLTTSYYAQQLHFVWDQLGKREGRILLIRLSGSNSSQLQGFLAQVFPYLS